LVQPEPREAQDLSDQPEQPALLVLQEFKELQEVLDQPDLSVLQASPEHLVFKERQEVLVQPALLAQQVLQVRLEFKGLRVLQALLGRSEPLEVQDL